MMICPYCNQGIILRAIIKINLQIIFICPECDAVWKEHEEISDRTGGTFSVLMNSIGEKDSWDELLICD